MSDGKDGKPVWEMTPELRRFEAIMQLKDLKAGDTVTAQHMGALNFFLGTALEAARKIPMTKMTFEPNKDGEFKLVKTEEVPQ